MAMAIVAVVEVEDMDAAAVAEVAAAKVAGTEGARDPAALFLPIQLPLFLPSSPLLHRFRLSPCTRTPFCLRSRARYYLTARVIAQNTTYPAPSILLHSRSPLSAPPLERRCLVGDPFRHALPSE